MRACCQDRSGLIGGADARAYARREPGRVDGGGQDDAHVGERRRLHRAARADQAADLVERKLRPHGDDADRQVGGEPQQPQRAGPGRLVAVGADRQFDEGGVGHGGAGRAVPLDDRRGGDGEPVQQHLVERAGRAGAFQPDRADLLLVEGDRRRGGRGVRRAGRSGVPSGATRISRPVPWSRIPATHSARPAEARASAGRSTRRRISVS